MFACVIRRYVTATVLELKLFANITEGVDSVIHDYKSDFGRLQRRDKNEIHIGNGVTNHGKDWRKGCWKRRLG